MTGPVTGINNGWICVGLTLSLAMAAPAPAAARDPGQVLQDIPPNRWIEIGRFAERAQWLQRHGGAVFDSRRGTMVFFGSDTHDRPQPNWDNAVHEFDPATGRWRTHYAPAAVSTYRTDAAGYRVAGTEQMQPWAMHVYDAIVYDPIDDALIVMGEPRHSPQRRSVPGARFDPTWNYSLRTRTWRQLENAGKRPPTFFAAAAAYDSARDVVVAYRNGLWELGPDRRQWVLANPERHHSTSFAMEYDARHRKLAVFGDYRKRGDVWIYSPGPTAGDRGSWERREIGGGQCPKSAQFPVAYDTRNGVFLLLPHDYRLRRSVTCVYDLGSNRFTRLPGADLPLLGSDENMSAMNYAMVYDSLRHVFLLATGYRRDFVAIHALRLDLPSLGD